jgi:hypothetical protein
MILSVILISFSGEFHSANLPFFEKLSQIVHEKFLDYLVKENRRSTQSQFDDMETSEHTKLKPVAISLVVTKKRASSLSLDLATQ